jgi:PKD repeat protein
MRGVSVALAFLVLLSGCASPDEPTDDTEAGTTGTATSGAGSGSATGTRTSSSTSSGTSGPGDDGDGNATDAPPTATLTATPAGANATEEITFALVAADPDGSDLAWSLDFGDGSQPESGNATASLAANVTHAYEAAGNYTAVLNVTSGGVSVQAEAAIVVAAGVTPFSFTHTLTTVFGCELCTEMESSSYCAGFNADENEVECAWVVLPPLAAGQPFSVAGTSPSPLTGLPVFGNSLAQANPEVEFLASCVHDAASKGVFVGDNQVEVGIVPPGAGCIVVWDFDETWVNIEFAITVG